MKYVMHKRLLWSSVGVTSLCASLALAGQGRGGRGGTPVNLPEGAGKEVVQGLCSSCHSPNLIVNSGGYTREGWQEGNLVIAESGVNKVALVEVAK